MPLNGALLLFSFAYYNGLGILHPTFADLMFCTSLGTKIVLYESVRRPLAQTLLQSWTLPDRDQMALSAMLKQGGLVTLIDSTGGYTVVINKVSYGFSPKAADQWGRLYPSMSDPN